MESSKELTPAQLARLLSGIARSRTSMEKLASRTDAAGFSDNDALKVAAHRACAAVEALHGVVRELDQVARLPRHMGGQRQSEVAPRDPRARIVNRDLTGWDDLSSVT